MCIEQIMFGCLDLFCGRKDLKKCNIYITLTHKNIHVNIETKGHSFIIKNYLWNLWKISDFAILSEQIAGICS